MEVTKVPKKIVTVIEPKRSMTVDKEKYRQKRVEMCIRDSRRILLEDAVENIRRRFGKCAISYAILMGDLKIPDDGRQLVTMPGLMYQ